MEISEIVEIVKEIIQNEISLDVLPDLKDDITEDLGADSLNRADIIMQLEGAFSIDITDDDYDKINTIEELADLIENIIN